MTGSVMDGEDIVQEALFEAYRKLDQYDERRPLKPWLFGIAHNRCIDFLRKRKARSEAEAASEFTDTVEPPDLAHLSIRPAVERLVTSLPPMERACVLLKDVFEYSLEEISELVGSTVGGVKSALKRGRMKLASTPEPAKEELGVSPEISKLLQLYVERFNRRDSVTGCFRESLTLWLPRKNRSGGFSVSTILKMASGVAFGSPLSMLLTRSKI